MALADLIIQCRSFETPSTAIDIVIVPTMARTNLALVSRVQEGKNRLRQGWPPFIENRKPADVAWIRKHEYCKSVEERPSHQQHRDGTKKRTIHVHYHPFSHHWRAERRTGIGRVSHAMHFLFKEKTSLSSSVLPNQTKTQQPATCNFYCATSSRGENGLRFVTFPLEYQVLVTHYYHLIGYVGLRVVTNFSQLNVNY